MNNDGREKDPDARRWGRCIDNPRRDIKSFPVVIRPINTPLLHMPMSSRLVTAVVMSYYASMVILAESRHHVYAADHYG